MIKNLGLIALIGVALSGCAVQNTMRAMECNKQAVEMSTQAICENIRAIEEANEKIAENRRHLEAINEHLQNVGQ